MNESTLASVAAAEQFGTVAEIYDEIMAVVPYPFWVDYCLGLLGLHGCRPSRVVDLACGTGNVLAELVRRGYQAEGADSSESMLAVARRKLPGVPLWHQDLRTMEIPGPPFDAALCLFDSLNYIVEPRELRAALTAVRKHLVPGGMLVFDVNAVRALETGMFNQKGVTAGRQIAYDWVSAWDPVDRLCTIRMEFRIPGPTGTQVLVEEHRQRGYSLAELRGLLDEAGWRDAAWYDAFSTRPPTGRSDRYHFIARA